MRFRIIILLSVFVFITSCSNKQIIELPIRFHDGYGPFKSAMGGMSPYDDLWAKTHLKTSGIPKNWTDVKIGDINTDIRQSVYQDYYQGNITKERYEDLRNRWNWSPDSINFSRKPIKCKIAWVKGTDSSGELKMIVDANNNCDFSDDVVFKPVGINPREEINADSLLKNNAVKVMFERFSNHKITKVYAPLLIVRMKQYNMCLFNFAQYATAKLKGEEIAVNSNDFIDLSYRKLGIIKTKSLIKRREKAERQNVVANNEYIEIGNKVYKNLGVRKNKLVLEKMNLPKTELSSAQIGFKAFDFSGNDVQSNTPITLESLKGKYVLLDFWATWCGPCIKEISNLNDLYKDIDKSKFAIISIVEDSSTEDLKKMIQKHSISWPQIISNDSNKIKEIYGINGYPTTFLLNPQGVIIAKKLRGKELKEKIIDLIHE